MNVALLVTLVQTGNDGTVPCLEECQRQIDALAATEGYSFKVFLNHKAIKRCGRRLRGRNSIFTSGWIPI